MTLRVPKFKTSLIPLHVSHDKGRILRVPLDRIGDWGIEYDNAGDLNKLIAMDRKGYKKEWLFGSGVQVDIVGETAEAAGLGDITNSLHDACASVGKHVVEDVIEVDGVVKVLDIGIGSGICAEVFFNGLSENMKDRIKIIGIDPSPEKISEAKARLKKLNAKHQLYACSDYDIPNYVKPGSVHAEINVAGGPHHNMLAPWGVYKAALKDRGIFINVDWDVDFWFPIIVYDMCMELDWPDKDEFDEKFTKTFLNEFPPELYRELAFRGKNESDIQAVGDMGNFWKGYGGKIITKDLKKENCILIPEGHIHPMTKIKLAQAAGFETYSSDIQEILSEGIPISYKIVRDGKMRSGYRRLKNNPHQIAHDSSLWTLSLYQRLDS